MRGVVDHSTNFLQYLNRIGLTIGKEMKLLEVIDFDKSIHVQINEKEKIFLSHEIAKNLLVNKS